MKKMSIILMILVTLIWAGLATAGEPAIQKGSTAIFYETGFVSIDGTKLGVQHLVMDKFGAGIIVGFSNFSEDNGDKKPEKTTDMSLDAYLIYYPVTKGSVALFAAPGVGFRYWSNKDKDDGFDDSQTDIYLGASIGAEWWLTDNVSLSAENWMGLGLTINKDKVADTKLTDTYLGIIQDSSYNFTLSFYFK
ncbi:MAG: hypothetical protein M0R34_09700 [Candidatus Marinimicrobia bacterium]|jgi:hypothetical protein|nr:hypothetical protein [Candidatus Neomarinimicrobiota bacterium]MCK9559517.1 hypothetical protein [Candidatus Neomarinimicrobiota bacterium]